MTMLQLPTYDDVIQAAERIAGAAHRTPVLTSRTVNEEFGAEVFFKCENMQRMGAFKFRGGYNALAKFSPEQRRAGVVAFSSGNHAQAIALSARLLAMPATIIMPEDAPAAKVAATRGYGATVVTYDRYTEDREQIGRALAERDGLTLIPPYDHADVIAGQGTAAKELFDEVGVSDDELVACMRFFAERMKIVVEPTGCLGFAAARKMKDSLRGKRIGVLVSGGNIDLARFASLIAA